MWKISLSLQVVEDTTTDLTSNKDAEAGFSVEPLFHNTCHGVTGECFGCQSALTRRSIGLSNANKRTTFGINYWVNCCLLVTFAMYLSSVLAVEVNCLFADHRMTEQVLRVPATKKYGPHIEFINLNPGLLQMSSFYVQKHGRCKAKGGAARDTKLFQEVQYCEKVMQAKCANFDLCFPDFHAKLRPKV